MLHREYIEHDGDNGDDDPSYKSRNRAMEVTSGPGVGYYRSTHPNCRQTFIVFS